MSNKNIIYRKPKKKLQCNILVHFYQYVNNSIADIEIIVLLLKKLCKILYNNENIGNIFGKAKPSSKCLIFNFIFPFLHSYLKLYILTIYYYFIM